MSVYTAEGEKEFEGCIIAFFHNLIFKSNRLDGVYSAMFR